MTWQITGQGGPEGEFGVGEVASVVQGAAQAVGELGEDRLYGDGALLAGLVCLRRSLNGIGLTESRDKSPDTLQTCGYPELITEK